MKYTLDVAKWRCGGQSDRTNSLGQGKTSMLNCDGFSCCLGQFALQKGVPAEALICKHYPSDVFRLSPTVYNYDKSFLDDEGNNTRLTICCANINDDYYTTVRVKIALLKDALISEGHELEVVNQQLIP